MALKHLQAKDAKIAILETTSQRIDPEIKDGLEFDKGRSLRG